MSRDKLRLNDYLEHMAQALERIEAYTAGMDKDAFLAAPMAQDAVIRNIEILGEASRNIQRHHPDYAAAHPSLPLALAYQMRNALAHGYFRVDKDIVWSTVKTVLPDLAVKVNDARYALEAAARMDEGPSP